MRRTSIARNDNNMARAQLATSATSRGGTDGRKRLRL
jgi:hypothetical protein